MPPVPKTIAARVALSAGSKPFTPRRAIAPIIGPAAGAVSFSAGITKSTRRATLRS